VAEGLGPFEATLENWTALRMLGSFQGPYSKSTTAVVVFVKRGHWGRCMRAERKLVSGSGYFPAAFIPSTRALMR